MQARMSLPWFATVLALVVVPCVSRADDDRPFFGALESTATNLSVTTDGLLRIEGTVAGHGTVIGKLTGTFVYDVNLADGSFVGALTKVAANGDEVHETFAGQFNADFTASVGWFEVIGGTGRFEDSTGGGPFTGEVTSPINVVVRFAGRISK